MQGKEWFLSISELQDTISLWYKAKLKLNDIIFDFWNYQKLVSYDTKCTFKTYTQITGTNWLPYQSSSFVKSLYRATSNSIACVDAEILGRVHSSTPAASCQKVSYKDENHLVVLYKNTFIKQKKITKQKS